MRRSRASSPAFRTSNLRPGSPWFLRTPHPRFSKAGRGMAVAKRIEWNMDLGGVTPGGIHITIP